jgi:hypothetical protein
MAPESAARCVAGLPARTPAGLAPAAMSGTRSRRVEFAPLAYTNGLRPSASRVSSGRCIRSGVKSETDERR